MIPQPVIMNDEPIFIRNKREVWYKWSCVNCGKSGETTDRHYTCHPEETRIVLAEREE